MIFTFTKLSCVYRSLWLSFTVIDTSLFTHTDATSALTIGRQIGVTKGKSVASNTVRLSSVNSSKTFSAQCIEKWRNGFKMDWINAISHAAQMIGLQFLGNGIVKPYRSNSVCVQHRPAYLKKCVSIGFISGTTPQPAWSAVKPHLVADIDLAEKAGKKLATYWNAVRIVKNHLGLQLGRDGLGATTFTESLCPSF